MSEELSPVETPKKGRGMLAFYVGSVVVVLLLVGLVLLWPRISARWQFERRWTSEKTRIELTNVSLWDIFTYIEGSIDINIIPIGDSHYYGIERVNVTLNEATHREVFVKALEGTGLNYRVYSADTVLVYRPGSDAYAAFRAGGLRWGPKSSGVRNAMSEPVNFCHPQAKPAEIFAYLASIQRIGLEADPEVLEKFKGITVRFSETPGTTVWDLCLRRYGLVGEVRNDKIYIFQAARN